MTSPIRTNSLSTSTLTSTSSESDHYTVRNSIVSTGTTSGASSLHAALSHYQASQQSHITRHHHHDLLSASSSTASTGSHSSSSERERERERTPRLSLSKSFEGFPRNVKTTASGGIVPVRQKEKGWRDKDRDKEKEKERERERERKTSGASSNGVGYGLMDRMKGATTSVKRVSSMFSSSSSSSSVSSPSPSFSSSMPSTPVRKGFGVREGIGNNGVGTPTKTGGTSVGRGLWGRKDKDKDRDKGTPLKNSHSSPNNTNVIRTLGGRFASTPSTSNGYSVYSPTSPTSPMSDGDSIDDIRRPSDLGRAVEGELFSLEEEDEKFGRWRISEGDRKGEEVDGKGQADGRGDRDEGGGGADGEDNWEEETATKHRSRSLTSPPKEEEDDRPNQTDHVNYAHDEEEYTNTTLEPSTSSPKLHSNQLQTFPRSLLNLPKPPALSTLPKSPLAELFASPGSGSSSEHSTYSPSRRTPTIMNNQPQPQPQLTLLGLPAQLLVHILSFLPKELLLRIRRTCTRFRDAVEEVVVGELQLDFRTLDRKRTRERLRDKERDRLITLLTRLTQTSHGRSLLEHTTRRLVIRDWWWYESESRSESGYEYERSSRPSHIPTMTTIPTPKTILIQDLLTRATSLMSSLVSLTLPEFDPGLLRHHSAFNLQEVNFGYCRGSRQWYCLSGSHGGWGEDGEGDGDVDRDGDRAESVGQYMGERMGGRRREPGLNLNLDTLMQLIRWLDGQVNVRVLRLGGLVDGVGVGGCSSSSFGQGSLTEAPSSSGSDNRTSSYLDLDSPTKVPLPPSPSPARASMSSSLSISVPIPRSSRVSTNANTTGTGTTSPLTPFPSSPSSFKTAFEESPVSASTSTSRPNSAVLGSGLRSPDSLGPSYSPNSRPSSFFSATTTTTATDSPTTSTPTSPTSQHRAKLDALVGLFGSETLLPRLEVVSGPVSVVSGLLDPGRMRVGLGPMNAPDFGSSVRRAGTAAAAGTIDRRKTVKEVSINLGSSFWEEEGWGWGSLLSGAGAAVRGVGRGPKELVSVLSGSRVREEEGQRREGEREDSERSLKTLRLNFSLRVDRRTVEKMLGAIGIGLGGSSEEDEGAADEGGAGEQISGGNREGLELLEVSVPAWNGERTDEVLYKIISMIIPRYRRLRTLLLKVAEEEREEEKDIEEGYEVGGAVTVTVHDADGSTSMSRNQSVDDTEDSTLTHSKSPDKLEQKDETLAPLTPTSTLTSSATVTPTSSTTPTPTAASYSYFPPSPRHHHQPHSSSDTSSLFQTQTHLSPPTSPAYNQNRFSTSTTFSLTPSHTSSLSAAQSHEYDIVYGSSGDHSSMFSPPTPTMTASTVSLGLFPFPPASPLPTTDSGKTRENEDEDEDEGKRLSVDSGLGADGRLISMYLNNMHNGQYAEEAEMKVGESFLNERRKSSIQFSPSSSISSVSQLVDKKEEFQNAIVVDTVEVASGGTESVSPVNKEEEDGNDVEESIEEFGHDVEQDEDNPGSCSGSDSNFSPTSTATGYFSPVSTFGTVNSPRTGPLKPGYESDVPPVPSLPPLDSLPPVRPRMSVSSAQTVKPAKEGKSGKSLASRLSRLPSLKNLKKQSSKKSAVNDDASPNSASSPIPTSLTSLESTPTLLPPGADTASRLAPAMPKYVPNANESSPPPLPPKSPQSQQSHDLASNIVTKGTPSVDSHNQPNPSSKGKASRFSTLSSLSTSSNLSGVSTLSSMSTMSVADAVIQRAGRSQLTPMTPTFRVTQVKPVVDGAENHVQRALSPRTVGVETSLSPSSQSLSSDFLLESPPNNKHNLRIRSAPELRAQTVDEEQGKEFTEIDEKEAIMVLAQEMDLREQRDREIRNTPLTQREKRHIRLWTRHCPTLEKVVFVSGKVWDVHGIVAEDKEEEVVEAEKKTVVVEKLDFGLELL